MNNNNTHDYGIKVIDGLHTSNEYAGKELQVLTFEFEGIRYNKIYSPDMDMEPYMVDAFLEDVGGAEELINSGILRKYCIELLAESSDSICPMTWGKLSQLVASYTEGWETAREYFRKAPQTL